MAMQHNILGSTKPQNNFFSMGDIVIWFLKGRKEHTQKFFKMVVQWKWKWFHA
jgi:hypothetical protein